MNNRIIRWGVALLLLVTMCCVSFAQADTTQTNTSAQDSTTVTAQDSSNMNNAAAEADSNTAQEDEPVEKTPLNIPWELVLSCLALVAAVAVYLLDQKAIKEAKHALDERINQRKTDYFQLEARLNSLEKALPGKVQAILQDQQDAFMAEQERKVRAMQDELAAKEEDFRRQREAEEEAARPKTYYAAYKESVKGFSVEFLSEERKANSTAVINTKSKTEAEFSLVPDLNPTAFRSIIGACEVVKGSPENYSSIEIVEPGRVERDDDAWVVVSKVKIACL
ncbi:MAG: hypothetical protein IJP49_11265 [Bacteroidales bacterium]|nr:hypothetical protein [Bacteroidales bacterium]